ncbi:hypothetical protein CcaverHIS631_0112200 [Cutaneotrichosporon cavernicola]|nr:hypothetical protein CcaverHIS631_0112200 [Cutaneotrichosporon cavernicola]BEJ04043.1 hypothetical protein CcaverHIS641_0112180 [Cutaneotrichosporon cavernicola]
MASTHSSRHAPTPSLSSAHSRTTSFSSAFSTLPPPLSSQGHGQSPSVSSSRAHTPSFGHGQSPSTTYTPSLGHNPSPSLGHAIPLTPIKELASAQSSPARQRVVSAAQREAAESGAPISGLYAKSGFWDDDSDDNEKERTSWRSRLSGSTSSNTGDRRSVKSTKSSKSGGGRSRSNTMSGIVSPSPPVDASAWPWTRKSQQAVPTMASTHGRGPSISQCHGRVPSVSQSHGRGPSMADSVGMATRPSSTQRPPSCQPFPTPSPSTVFPSPSSTFQSPATPSSAELPSHTPLPEVPQLRPRKSKTRLRLLSKSVRQNEMDSQDLKTPIPRPPLSPVTNTNTPTAKRAPTPLENKALDGKKQSAWKRGMERLWRSKSAGNMREQYRHTEQENMPPVPSLPVELVHENARARLTSQAQAGPPRPLSPAAPEAAFSPPFALSPDPSVHSPPLAFSPDPSASYLSSPKLNGGGGLARAHSHRSSKDDSILAQLDQKYPTYCALSARINVTHIDDMEKDPFASAIDYSYLLGGRRPSRSPLPQEFGALPSPPPIEGVGTPRNSPSLTNLKQSLVPRLRKSKSMGVTRRPSSILSHFRSGVEGGRMSRGASPVPSPTIRPSTPDRVPALDELVAVAMRESPLAPPRPQFYDSFDLGDDSDSKDAPQQCVEPLENLETMDLVSSAPTSRRGSLRSRTTSTSQAPDLSIDVTAAVSVSGSSIELVTPQVSQTGGSGRHSPDQSPSDALEHPPALDQDDIMTPTAMQEMWGRRGHSRTQSEEAFTRALAQKAHRRNENPSQDDRSETCPSTFGTQSWEAAIAAFPTIDDHVNSNPFHNYCNNTGPGERESLASNTAVAPTDSCTHSFADDTPPSRSYDHNHAESSSDAPPSDQNSAMWSSWRDVPRRRVSGQSESSRGSSRSRHARTVEGAWDDSGSDTSESEDEDVPLGSLHPGAAAAQQQRLAEQKKRREARRAHRAMREAKKEAELRRSATSVTNNSRRQWNGEGIPPDALAGQLERVAVKNAPPIPSRALRPPPCERSDSGTPSLSRSTTVGRSASGHSARSGASGQRIPSDGDRSAALSRATSINSQATRKRSQSNAGRMPMPTTPTEPTPARRSTAVRCMVVRGSDARPINLDAFPETTARDVLMTARARGDIAEGNWVVVESFAELGLERQVREHELILSGVLKGWDATAPNVLVLREMPAHNVWTRNIPDTPPMVCGWVQLETKPGKWAKKWLDVRGGQVFLSKNEKGKDEVHISTLFTDVYTVRKSRQAPMPYTFALKRLDAAASFQNPAEYISFLATDDALGWKLHSAIFASRSVAMAQADPGVRARLNLSAHTHSHSQSHSHSFTTPAPAIPIGPSLAKHTGPSRTPTGHSSRPRPRLSAGHGPSGGQPLVDLKAKQMAGFTGQGLLRSNHQL